MFGNFPRESAQLPLYTISTTGTLAEKAFAIVRGLDFPEMSGCRSLGQGFLPCWRRTGFTGHAQMPRRGRHSLSIDETLQPGRWLDHGGAGMGQARSFVDMAQCRQVKNLLL